MSFSEKQIESIEKLFKDNPKIIVSPDLLKLNKCVSFMTFIIKEIYDYTILKSSDGALLVKIRSQISEYQMNKEKLEKIKKFFG